MKKLNTTADIKKYLKSGDLTKPFLRDSYIKEKVEIDFEAKRKKGNKDYTILDSLMNWIHFNVVYDACEEFVSKFLFCRTAQEIWGSKKATGCTDYALLFSTFARQLGISTTNLYAVEKGWLERLLKGGDTKKHYAHSFCECYFEGKWILLDPTSRKIQTEYDCEEIKLKYKLGEFSQYIPIKRCVDLEKKHTLKEHCDWVDKICYESFDKINYKVRLASVGEIETWWNKKISKNPNDLSYKKWKENFVEGNKNGLRKTFFAFDNGKYIGQGTLLLESNDKVLTGKGKAEIIKLEILPKYRGRGIATKIFKEIEKLAKKMKIKMLTIGVEPCEVKNMQIYFHWGFTQFLQCISETYPPKAEGEKGETITVLCYGKKI